MMASTGSVKTAFWSMLTVLMVAGLLYNLYMVSTNYASYPVAVGISIVHANDLNFPTVTICNMSPVKASSLLASAKGGGGSSGRKRRKRSAGIRRVQPTTTYTGIRRRFKVQNGH